MKISRYPRTYLVAVLMLIVSFLPIVWRTLLMPDGPQPEFPESATYYGEALESEVMLDNSFTTTHTVQKHANCESVLEFSSITCGCMSVAYCGNQIALGHRIPFGIDSNHELRFKLDFPSTQGQLMQTASFRLATETSRTTDKQFKVTLVTRTIPDIALIPSVISASKLEPFPIHLVFTFRDLNENVDRNVDVHLSDGFVVLRKEVGATVKLVQRQIKCAG
jgi:hypothetical protein